MTNQENLEMRLRRMEKTVFGNGHPGLVEQAIKHGVWLKVIFLLLLPTALEAVLGLIQSVRTM